MASESTDGRSVSSGDDLDTWLDERAGELGLDRDQLVEQLLAAYRTAVADFDFDSDDADAASLDARLDRVERDHDADIEEVRKRILQLKDAAEAKAPADHHHEAFDQLDDLDEQVATLERRVASLSETSDRLLDQESVTDDELAEVETKLDRLARAVVELRSGETNRSGEPEADDRLRELRRTAAREGHEQADCGACGETLHVGLLPDPSCPACDARFEDIEGGGLFRNATLHVEAVEL